MPRSKAAEDLSVEELRRLLVEKSRQRRERRLDAYRRTGRIIPVAPAPAPAAVASLEADELLPAPRAQRRQRTALDGFLLLLELAAVAGLIFIIFRVLNVLVSWNSEFAAALKQPELTPTPMYRVVVLPSGHTSPALSQDVSFNKAEIPEHLQPFVAGSEFLPIPTPGPAQAIRIRIPRIRVDASVVQGDGFEQLKKGVGQHLNGVDPGENGNLVLSAHNDVFGEIFRYLDELKPGDEIYLYTSQREYVYIVSEVRIVEPTALEVLDQTQEAVVTLISCYPYRVDDKRIIVRAYLQGK